MRTVVVGVCKANTRCAGDDVVGLLGLGFVGDNTLVGSFDLIGAVSKQSTGGLLSIVGVGRLAIHKVGTVIHGNQRLVSHTALEHGGGVYITALGRTQFLFGIALSANHKGAVLHQGNLSGSVLHIVHFVTGLVAASFFSVQILSVVVGIAGTVRGLCQHADAWFYSQQIAFPGVITPHTEVVRSIGFLTVHGPLVIDDLVNALGSQDQHLDGFHGLASFGLLRSAQEGLLVEVIDLRTLRCVGFGFQLSQDLIGPVGIINGID